MAARKPGARAAIDQTSNAIMRHSRGVLVTSTTIQKSASDPGRFARPTYSFINARTAFKAYLIALDLKPHDEILLPSYIGWSSREGSGVFDPIAEVGVSFRFYRLTRNLNIDIEDLRTQLRTGRPRMLVIIHYFGFPDPHLVEAVALAKEKDVLILEDEAHALYSDWVGGVCGRHGEACIISLHKMLPMPHGGLLILNEAGDTAISDAVRSSPLRAPLDRNPWDYDLLRIAAERQNHARRLISLLPALAGRVDPLFPSVADGVVPQTLPVLISGASRDDLYFRLNKAGFGVVSLYHTQISALTPEDYAESHWLARRILNLPVHQDILPHQLESMINHLTALLT